MVAPKNVVVMEVAFGSLGAGQKGRLEAANVGSGRAWIATNGIVVRGTWKKLSAASPTRFFDGAGKAVPLTIGQTFVQVMPTGSPDQGGQGHARQARDAVAIGGTRPVGFADPLGEPLAEPVDQPSADPAEPCSRSAESRSCPSATAA